MADDPLLPGGIGVSHLRVYDSVAPDGLRGGTPHLHTACTEAYAVVAGSGVVQTLTLEAGLQETPLERGALVWFTPGTIHRLVNHGDLEIFVLMQNAGLPEAGDMVITFGADVMTDPARYSRAATLPSSARTTDGPDAPAMARRDAAVTGFLELVSGGRAALEEFHGSATELVRQQVAAWRSLCRTGPEAAVQAAAGHLDALERGDATHLGRAAVHRRAPAHDLRRYGCCGTLGTLVSDG